MEMQQPTGPASVWRANPGRVINPMGLAVALALLGDATLYTVLPTHTADAGIALGSVGVILGVNRAVRLLLNAPAGLAYDRWPRRRLFLPAAAIGVLSTLIYALSGSFWTLLAGRLLWGLAWSGLWVGAQAITLDIAEPDNRGRLMGRTQAWFFLGGAISFLAGGFLTDLLSYRQALWIGAALSAAGALAAVFFLPETGGRAGQTSPRPSERPADRTGGLLNSLLALGPALRGGGWTALYAYAILRFCTAGVVAATISIFIQQQLGGQVRIGALLLGASMLTGILLGVRPLLSLVTSPWAGALSDRQGRWRLLRWGAWLGAASFLLLAQGSLLAIVASGLLVSLATGILNPIASALMGDLTPADSRGLSLGWLLTAGDFGSAIGPVVAYALLPVLGLGNLYLICAVLMASIWLVSLGQRADLTPQRALA